MRFRVIADLVIEGLSASFWEAVSHIPALEKWIMSAYI